MRKVIHRLFDESTLYSKNEISAMLTQVYTKKGIFVNKSISSTEIKRWYDVKTVRGHDFDQIKLLKKKH